MRKIARRNLGTLNIAFSLHREMENQALICKLPDDPRVKNRTNRITKS